MAVAHLRKVIDAAADAGRRGRQHVRRPRPGAVGRRQLAAVPRGLAAAGRARRGAGRADRDRELPDALHRRRVARRQEPGDQPGDLAADVRRHPEPELRAELRPVAPRLAADGLPRPARASSATGSSTSTPRTRGSTGRRSTSTACWPTPSAGTRPSCPAWATSAGAPSSRALTTPATTARSPSRSRTAPSRARSQSRRESLVLSRRYLLQFLIG